MGHWLERASERHQHDMPKFVYDGAPFPGDRWECACGQVFVVWETSFESSVKPGESFYRVTWRSEEGQKPTPYGVTAISRPGSIRAEDADHEPR